MLPLYRSNRKQVNKKGIWLPYITPSVQMFTFFIFALALPRIGYSATFNVDRFDDNAQARTCSNAPNDCSLRGAILAANASAGADTINLGAGDFAVSLIGDRIDGPTGLPSITSDITINGAGAAMTFIDNSVVGEVESRIFRIASIGTLTLNGLGIRRGGFLLEFDGGNIFNNGGTLNITNSAIGNSQARQGGVIFSTQGKVNITNSIVAGSRSEPRNGGGIFNDRGTMTITSSTIGGSGGVNFAQGGGAGIFNDGGTITITNGTIADNTVDSLPGGGGILNNGGTITITNSTITDNHLDHDEAKGAGIFNDGGTVKLVNTILALNERGNCSGTITSLGNNLIDDTTGCTIALLPSDIKENPGLVGDGDTSPSGLSLAIDAGNDAFCPRIDQKGQARVCACDIGAVEFQPQRILNVPPNDSDRLIERLTEANTATSYDVINLEGGTYILNAKADDTDGPNGLPSIKSKICIRSTGTSTTTIQRDPDPDTPAFRILHVAPRGALTLERLTIRGGLAADNNDPLGTGGGILNTGALTLLDSTVRNNRAFLNGGGIENSARAVLTRSTISGNVADTFGGGINNFVSSASTGMLTLTDATVSGNDASDGGGIENSAKAVVMRSTISGNTTDGRGGGIANIGDKTELTLLNSTISTNMAGSGGGIANFGAATLTSNNVTITKNTASEGASGFLNEVGSTVNISNTIIAQNNGTDCDGSFNVDSQGQGFNLIQNMRGCTVGGAGNILGMDPRLGPLGNNGGPTQTHLLLSNSPAIDGGSPAVPGSGGPACESFDQRGFSRPVDGPDQGTTATCDIGAVEFGMSIVNNSFSEPTRTPATTSNNTSGCPTGFVGKLSFTATFRNTSSSSLSNLVFEVKELTNGNLLQDRGGGLGGIGARLAVPTEGGFSDGILQPNQSVPVPFVICLRDRDRFRFLVDLLGQ